MAPRIRAPTVTISTVETRGVPLGPRGVVRAGVGALAALVVVCSSGYARHSCSGFCLVATPCARAAGVASATTAQAVTDATVARRHVLL
jgi:hypothetical protein